MKKLLTGLLAVLTCFTCATAVACGDNNKGNNNNSNSESTIPEDLQTAAEYLEEMYRSKYAETRVDFEVLSAIMGYPITWSVNVTEGVQVVVADGKVTIDVNELLDADLDYVLTALITDEAGNTTTVSFNRKVLAAPSLIPVAITAAPEEGVAYKYHVYQSTLGTDMYFAGGMAATYYFKTTTNYEEAVDVYAEYLAGSTTEFYLYFNHSTDGKQYFGVQVSEDGAHDNIVYKSEPVSFFVWNEELGTVTTHLEATKNNGGPNDFYFGNYGTKDTISASYTSYAGGAGNNVGHLVTMVDKNSITPESKVEESKEALALSFTEVAGAKEMELPAARHADVAVTWTVSENAYASIVDGKLVTTNPAEDTTVTLTATLTCGEVTATKEFTVTLKFADNLPAADSVITIAKALEIGAAQEHNTYTENKYYIVATIKEVYNAQYGNMYLVDEAGNQFTLYGSYNEDGTVRYDAMESKPVAGDVVKVYGNIGQYNGTAQMKNGWIIEWNAGSGSETPDEPVTPPAEEVTWTAAVPEVNKPYIFGMTQANVDNTVYYLAGGMNGYYMATTTDPNAAIETYIEATEGGYYFYTYVGETKTYINMVVSGTHVNGAYEATASTVYTIDETNKTLIAVVNDTEYWFATRNDNTYTTMGPCAVSYAGFFGVFYTNGQAGGEVTPPAGGEDGGETEEPETPAEIQTLTIPEAITLGKSQAHDTYTADKYYVYGIIVAITNTTYGNMTIADVDGNEFTVYGSYSADGATQFGSMTDKPVVGEYVKFLSVVGQYSNAPQLKNAWIIEVSEATPAQKIAIEKGKVSVAEEVTGARELELATTGATYSDVAIAWTVVAGSEIATYANGVLSITNPSADTVVTVKATLSISDVSVDLSFNIKVAHKDETVTEPTELAVFEFGANGNAAHVDGNDLGASKSYSENGYTLALTGVSKVYGPAYDATGNSCIKLGTSKVIGEFTFTVPAEVTKVVIKVAGYKANTATVSINGTNYSVSTASNNGAYTDIEIDTTTTKTITFATVSSSYRAMINSITFIG